jgi:undecaprenyl-diphosphatase
MCLNINTKTAADFSFLISVPVISAATLYELLKSWSDFNSDQVGILVVGLLTSFIVAIFAIKSFISVLKKYGLMPFAYYRIIFGILYYWLNI